MSIQRRKPIPGIPKRPDKPTLWQRLAGVSKWLWGTIGLGAIIATAAGTYFKQDLFPQLTCEMRELQRSPADGSRFTVLVSTLAGDTDGRQTRHVVGALENEKGFEKLATCRALVKDLDTMPEGRAQADAENTARDWLDQYHAEVLVWGEVKGADKSLRLRFFSAAGGSDARSYGLDSQTLNLPASFGAEFATQVVALVLTATRPAMEETGQYLVDRLRPVADRLRQLHEHPPSGATPDQRASLAASFGLALSTIGDQRGDSALLREAIVAYGAALRERPRDRVPLDWALTQTSLDDALSMLGERESDTARLEAALGAYRAALEERTRNHVPLEWAATQNNLGIALWRLGERESGTARLEAAVEAYRAALEEWTRDRVPLDWAATQTNLGNALQALGGREPGTGRLEAAVEAYRAALEERTRDRVPLDWAATQNNLGNALSRLDERENGTARLEAAVEAYRAALEEQTRDRVPLKWAATQNNLGSALSTLGERESGTARLEAAVAAYRAAQEEQTRDRVPLNWARTQNNLGIALRMLGERENGTARLEQAVSAYRAAMDYYEQAGMVESATPIKGILWQVETRIAERRAAVMQP